MSILTKSLFGLALVLSIALLLVPELQAQGMTMSGSGSALQIPAQDLVLPEALVKVLGDKAKPALLLHVGSHMMYAQAHIPGSEFIGPGSQPAGIEALRKRAASIGKNQVVVIYCGCCPWERCPNVAPAYALLKSLGIKVKVLAIAQNFGADWVAKGYPVARGE